MSTLVVQQQPIVKIYTQSKLSQNRLPLVRVVTSKTNFNDEQAMQSFPFQKTIKFLQDSHTSHLIDRRVHLCHRLYRQHKTGYLLKDLNYLMKIYNILAQLCQEQAAFIDPFIEILENCSKPFLMDKSIDTETYASALISFYSDFGYLLRVANKRIQQCILETLYKSIQHYHKSSLMEQDYDNLKPVTSTYLLQIQCSSDLCETLVKALSMIENDLKLRISIVKLLQIYSSTSSECVAKMLKHDCITRLASRMNDNDPSGELLFRTIELLWNILEYGNSEQIRDQLNSRVTISLLKEAFFGQVSQSHCHSNRQLRNDILIVCSLMLNINPNIPVIETGFAKQLLLLASYPELRSNSPLIKGFRLTTSDEDFEFKKLLINMVVILNRNPSMKELIAKSRVLLALLSYIEPLPRKTESERSSLQWTKAQYEDLQLHALVALSILLPNSLNEYFEYGTNTKLFIFYEWTINNEEYKSDGNCYFGKDGRNTKRAQAKYILRLFRSIISTKNERILNDLTQQGIITSIIGYLRMIMNDGSSHLDYLDLDIVCDGLFILSCLGESDLHRKEIFGTDGIDLLIQTFTIESPYVCGGLGYHRLLVAAIDCVWCCIVGSLINEDEFIQKQGVFALLDLIEKNPKSLQNIVLGCLLDLTENSKCIQFIMTWQGRKQEYFPHVLCALWRDEERETHVSRTERGIINDAKSPLMGALQQSVPITSVKRNEPSRAILDLIDNMRSKIYGFYCKIGYTGLPGLLSEDFVTLCIIENFLEFKLGEIWQELMIELEMEGVKLTNPDIDATDTILRSAEERVLAVAATQKYILEQYDRQDLHYERVFYHELVKNHEFHEKQLEQWKSYVERTSKYPLLMVAKDAQNLAIRHSRRDETDYKGYHTVHNLEIPNLSITAFTGPYLKIESTPLAVLLRKQE